jgi:ubiquinone/menaquinone biosynthesis C-methylase UbiE
VAVSERSGVFPEIVPAGGDTATPLNLRKRLRFIMRRGWATGTRLLDCGCGAGEYVVALRRLGVEAFGVEFQEEKVVRARELGVPSDWILRGDLEQLPYADQSFDAALLNEVLEHVPDERKALGEVWRVLGPGGALIVLSPNRLFPFETHGVSLRRSGRALPPSTPLIPYVPLPLGRKLFHYWARNYWPRELANLVISAGFRVVHRDFLWQTFENISGQQPGLIAVARPLWRALATVGERLPVVRRLGVSQALVATKPGFRPTPH